MSKALLDRKGILKAIQKAGKKLGRAPSWAELRRLTGVPESRVRVYFKSLAEAVRAAGLEPRRVGLPVTREELLEDFARVVKKLGRRPSRNEYVKLGEFSAGAFYNQFGSWTRIEANAHHGGTHPVKPTSGFPGTPAEARRQRKGNSPQIDADEGRLKNGSTPAVHGMCTSDTENKESSIAGSGDAAAEPICHPVKPKSGLSGTPIPHTATSRAVGLGSGWILQGASSWEKPTRIGEGGIGKADVQEEDERELIQLPAEILMRRLPAELEGKKRVTSAVCAMIVNTLLGADAANWHEELRPYLEKSKEPTADERGLSRIGEGLPLVNMEACSGGVIDKKRAVMGAPFVPLAMTHAPVNELGVMVLFGMLAGLLGFQIHAVWGKYPDCNVTQQIEPRKFQDRRAEVEFESRNFARHKHPARMCDVLICWIHNWKECPKHIQVIELKSVVEALLGRRIG